MRKPQSARALARRRAGAQALVVLVSGWLLIWGGIAVYRLTMREPVIPVDAPSELESMPIASLSPFQTDGLIEYQSNPIQVRIECSSIYALKQLWYGTDANLQIEGRGSEIAGISDQRAKSWGDTIWVYSDENEEVHPTFSALLPVTKDDVHQTLRINATMNVFYPRRFGTTTFVDESGVVTRKLSLLVISPEEMRIAQQIQFNRNGPETWGGELSVLWLVFGGNFAILLYLHVLEHATAQWTVIQQLKSYGAKITYSFSRGQPDIVRYDNNNIPVEVIVVKSCNIKVATREGAGTQYSTQKGHRHVVSFDPSRNAKAEVRAAREYGLNEIRLVVINSRTGSKIFEELVGLNQKITYEQR